MFPFQSIDLSISRDDGGGAKLYGDSCFSILLSLLLLSLLFFSLLSLLLDFSWSCDWRGEFQIPHLHRLHVLLQTCCDDFADFTIADHAQLRDLQGVQSMALFLGNIGAVNHLAPAFDFGVEQFTQNIRAARTRFHTQAG